MIKNYSYLEDIWASCDVLQMLNAIKPFSIHIGKNIQIREFLKFLNMLILYFNHQKKVNKKKSHKIMLKSSCKYLLLWFKAIQLLYKECASLISFTSNLFSVCQKSVFSLFFLAINIFIIWMPNFYINCLCLFNSLCIIILSNLLICNIRIKIGFDLDLLDYRLAISNFPGESRSVIWLFVRFLFPFKLDMMSTYNFNM